MGFALMLSASGEASAQTIKDSNYSTIGKVEADGTVRDSRYMMIGSAKGIPTIYAAVYFFFDMF